MLRIQDIIEQHVRLGHVNRGGWNTVTCPVCNDYKPRAGFRFGDEGESVTYHCFNENTCGGAYNPFETAGFMSSNMIKVLNAFNVPKETYQELIFQNTTRHLDSNRVIQKEKITPDYIKFPEEFQNVNNVDTLLGELAREYLNSRGISYNKYPFYILPNETQDPHFKKWNCRLIMPAFRNDKVIYYQGRNLLEDSRRKYESCSYPSDKVVYNFDELFTSRDIPLLVFEGLLDGLSISTENFVSLMSSNITFGQQTLLMNSVRQKIIVPDQRGNGWELAKQAIDLGFSVSFPNIKGCKDVNEACLKYGRLYVLQQIMDNVKQGYEAEMFMNLKKVGL